MFFFSTHFITSTSIICNFIVFSMVLITKPLPVSFHDFFTYVRTYILVSACAFDGSWEKAVGIYNRMLLPNYTEQGKIKGTEAGAGAGIEEGTEKGTGPGLDSSIGQSLKDEKMKEEKKEKKEKEGEGEADKECTGEGKGDSSVGDRRGGGGGVGVARDVGTYKALIPILEAASSSSTLPLPSTSSPTSSSTSSLSSSTPLRSINDIEKARTILESVRRTGRIEGLIH